MAQSGLDVYNSLIKYCLPLIERHHTMAVMFQMSFTWAGEGRRKGGGENRDGNWYFVFRFWTWIQGLDLRGLDLGGLGSGIIFWDLRTVAKRMYDRQ